MLSPAKCLFCRRVRGCACYRMGNSVANLQFEEQRMLRYPLIDNNKSAQSLNLGRDAHRRHRLQYALLIEFLFVRFGDYLDIMPDSQSIRNQNN